MFNLLLRTMERMSRCFISAFFLIVKHLNTRYSFFFCVVIVDCFYHISESETGMIILPFLNSSKQKEFNGSKAGTSGLRKRFIIIILIATYSIPAKQKWVTQQPEYPDEVLTQAFFYHLVATPVCNKKLHTNKISYIGLCQISLLTFDSHYTA